MDLGRRDGIPRDERLCLLCDLGDVEDQHHLLLDCPAYTQERARFGREIGRSVQTITLGEAYGYPWPVAMFIHAAMEKRKMLLRELTA